MLDKLFSYNKNDSLIRDGFILFSATMIANIAAYFYHVYMGRVLGPEDYGILGVILSIFYVISVPFYVIQMTITKFVAHLHAQKQEATIHILLARSLRKMFILGAIVFLVYTALTVPLAAFLHVPTRELIVFSPLLIFALLLPVTRGIIQGTQHFKSLGFNMILEAFAKLILGIALVFIGFHVSGAIAGIVLSYVIAFIAAFSPLKPYRSHREGTLDTKSIYSYVAPVFIALLALTLYYSLDVFLVKHYFSELDAGYYAAASLIGKIIFFGTFSLGMVMFPKAAELYSLQKENKNLLTRSLLLMGGGASVLVLAYFLAPTLIVLPLFGSAYRPITPLIGLFGVAMTFFSFSYLLSLYNLSVQRTSFIPLLIVFNILEAAFIYLYHTSLVQIIFILMTLMLILFLTLLIYTYKSHATTP